MAALRWHRLRPGLTVASCGEELQGNASVQAAEDNCGDAYRWTVDMLPGDSEPYIIGTSPTYELALKEAEAQVKLWPRLLPGAKRV